MNDIAILCRDVRFCRMLEVELNGLGYSVICNPRGGSVRLWLADLDSVILSPQHSERVYLGLSRDIEALTEEQRSLCLRILPRPIDMQKLCEAVNTLLSPDRILLSKPSAHVHLQRTPLGFELDGEPLSLTASEERIWMRCMRGAATPFRELSYAHFLKTTPMTNWLTSTSACSAESWRQVDIRVCSSPSEGLDTA